MNDHNLSDEEQKLFNNLDNEMNPSPSLEKKIIKQLKGEGLINISSGTGKHNNIRIIISAAAAILLFFGGIYFEKYSSDSPIAIEPELGYMFILHEDQNFEPGNSKDMYDEYSRWMRRISEGGIKIAGQELRNEATILYDTDQIALLDEDSDERTTGYFIIEANSLDEAVEVARNSPHLKYGGTIEVKAFRER